MHELVETSAAFLMTFGVVGACGPSVFVVAAGSQTGMRRMLLATLGMPGGALLFGAIYTPPDVLTQMLAAAMVAVSWLLGLAAGVSARLLLGQRRHAGDRS
jgi:Sec-independent protein secretion pathway component TatC